MTVVWAGSRNPHERDLIAQWCADQIWPGQGKAFDRCTCLGVIDREALIGAIVFTDYDPDAQTIEFSMAATSGRWLTLKVMEEMRKYCIDQLGCQLVTAKTKASNTHIRKMLKAYGFEEFVIPRLFGREEDGVIFTITAEQVEESRISRRSRHGRT